MEIANGLTCTYISEYTDANTRTYCPHDHPLCELYIHIEGSCSFTVNGSIHRMKYGSVAVTRGGERHGIRIDRACRYERCVYHIKEPFDFLGTTAHMRAFHNRPSGQSNVIQLSPESTDKCLKLIRGVELLSEADSPDARAMAVAGFLTLLTEVNKAFDNITHINSDKQYNPIVSEALRYIDQNFRTISSLNELADQLFVTREYLSRRFSHDVGISLNRYITLKRIEYAKYLLRNGDSLDSICEKCGWNDYSYFIYQFRKETGVTPAKYAKSNI